MSPAKTERRSRTLAPGLLALLLLASCASNPARPAVRRAEWVAAGDASLYLEVRGPAAAPVLLWLHGGPGGAERPMFRLFNESLEGRFRVAYYDQRGAGRSAEPDPSRLTVARHLSDLDRVIDHLLETQRASRVVLVGHSWGTQLGTLYAARHPDKVSAVVGVNQVVSELRRQQAQFRSIRDAAGRSGRARSFLAETGAPPWSAAQEQRAEAVIDAIGGLWASKPSFVTAMAKAIWRGLVSPAEIGSFIAANRRSLEAMNSELLALDLAAEAPELGVPVALFLGRHDGQAAPDQARAWLAALKAPQRLEVTFAASAHNIPFEEPRAFEACLIESLALVGAVPPSLSIRGSADIARCPYPVAEVAD